MVSGRNLIKGARWRTRPTVLRAAWWALRSVRSARRQLAAGQSHPVVAPPPPLPASAGLGVEAVVTRTRASCLEGAVVRQVWLAAHGIERDVVIGLPKSGFGETPAHAWVDGLDPEAEAEHLELMRISAASTTGTHEPRALRGILR